ncbi:hypothetical protein D9757_008837 [Collybiopsis confluens]|uniref:Uncharacterized protein n=1 Tax=Collybiopsis confluens TaxID=2823264 RepID=A0A8H5M0D4_9AGAR|nr:hypothetical protein D9757_008837 [Collybiopsis confluens]
MPSGRAARKVKPIKAVNISDPEILEVSSGNDVASDNGEDEDNEDNEDELDEDDEDDEKTIAHLSPRSASVPLPDDPLHATPELMAALDKEEETQRVATATATSKSKSKSKAKAKAKSKATTMKDRSKLPPAKTSKSKTLPALQSIKCPVKLYEFNQFSKPHKSRTSSLIRNFVIERHDEWDAIKLEMLKIIDNYWAPSQLHFDDYEVTYTIARKVSDPASLVSEEDFSSLLAITDPAKETTANVYICAKKPVRASAKENENLDDPSKFLKKRKRTNNEDDGSDEEAWMFDEEKAGTEAKKKKEKKDKKPEPKLNIALAQQMELLRAKWQCSETDGSDHCYWTEQDRMHKPISNSMFRTWAEALLKNDPNIADLDNPPNHDKFASLHSGKKMAISPLLQRRRRETTQNESSSGPSNHIHVHVSDYLSDRASAPAPTVAPLPAAAPLPTTVNPVKLVPGSIGADMSVDDFGTKFELTEAVVSRLKTNGYMKLKTLRHVTLDELASMGFKPGEVASLRDAVEDWTA